MGGSIEAIGDADFSEISATALSRHWVEILDLVADVALHPSMPEGTFKAVRDFLLRQIRNRGDNPTTWRSIRSPPGSTVRIPTPGIRSGSRRASRRSIGKALLAHYRRHYVPGGMVLAVSGR